MINKKQIIHKNISNLRTCLYLINSKLIFPSNEPMEIYNTIEIKIYIQSLKNTKYSIHENLIEYD